LWRMGTLGNIRISNPLWAESIYKSGHRGWHGVGRAAERRPSTYGQWEKIHFFEPESGGALVKIWPKIG
jgi:hypothetical protein